jgi:hypothetical protein
MWTKIELNQSSQLFQDKINEYLDKSEFAELLKVIEVRDADNKIYKYTGYILNGNLCVLISQWLDLFDGKHFTHDSMIMGEIKELLECEKIQWWFK